MGLCNEASNPWSGEFSPIRHEAFKAATMVAVCTLL